MVTIVEAGLHCAVTHKISLIKFVADGIKGTDESTLGKDSSIPLTMIQVILDH